VFVCINCARPIFFGTNGWIHTQESSDCVNPMVAWPPPGAEEADDERHGADAA
jgi:hypothetical protein